MWKIIQWLLKELYNVLLGNTAAYMFRLNVDVQISDYINHYDSGVGKIKVQQKYTNQ